MPFVEYNANPINKRVGDCTVRAISAALGQSWEDTYLGIVVKGYTMCDMPSANNVWGAYLKDNGFVRRIIPTDKVCDYTVADFAHDHPTGTYILALQGYVVCVSNGDWYDSWDSGNETPIYYWERK